MTNYEWLKTLSVEDLAENIRQKCRLCTFYNDDCSCGGELDCLKGISAWLREEHKEEHKEKLKPCPFCGSEDVYLLNKDGYADLTTVIFCNACKSTVFIEDNEEEGYDDKTREKAIEAWNRREGE